MNHKLINQDSGNVEYYTPPFITRAAKAVMGSIDLDPASSEAANVLVGATRYYTKEDDGLAQVWQGNVWMNHPFGRGENPCAPNCKKKKCIERGHHITERIPRNAEWIAKLLISYKLGLAPQAMCITYASTSESWFQILMKYPQCYLYPRTNYYGPDGKLRKGVSKGSAVTYLGPNLQLFKREFGNFGTIMIPVP